MFEARNVVHRYRSRTDTVTALAGVDLVSPPGAITALLGPSGSGKSTLLRILAGFERPDSGEVLIDGEIVASHDTFVPPQRRHVGIVMQEGSLFPHLDVAANVAYGLPGNWSRYWSTARRRDRAARVEELLEMVGLPGYSARRPDELSGGQQQRVALARALAPAPAAILLDEPFSALDTGLRVELREEVCGLLRSLETTTVLVTHDQGEALSLADHVVILRDGKVVQSGPPDAVYARPIDAATADLLGDVVLVRAAADSVSSIADCLFGKVDIDGCPADCSDGGECLVVLRPEQLSLNGSGVPATVVSTSFFGHDAMVRLRVDGMDEQLLVRTLGDLPEVGGRVHVAVTPGTVAHAVPLPGAPMEQMIA
ncbi:MAG TPA: ABC transporter ATP-binding protein [Acidimicrobiales bacterium]|nr:ABC transporter ATP-binding protein [Acidimicrobiales bacterium]